MSDFSPDPEASIYELSFQFACVLAGRNFTNAVWIKYLGLFFNLEAKATQIYNDMAASYNQTASTASNASGATKPVVAFVSYYNSPPTVSYRISVSSDRSQRAAVSFFDSPSVHLL